MNATGLKVLLIEPDKKQNEFLTEILIELDYQVISSGNVETALKNLLEFTPHIVICQNEMNEHSGFHFYNILSNKMLGNRLPFVLLMNKFHKDDLSVGIELGIDSFLFPPFEKEKIQNILNKQLQKHKENYKDAVTQFRSMFDDTPLGIFELRNKKVTDANQTFYRLIDKSNAKYKDFNFTEIFNFNNGHNNELKLLRCLSGIAPHTSFYSVPLHSDSAKKFNIYLSFIENRASFFKMIGLIIPNESSAEANNFSISQLIQERNKILKGADGKRVKDELFTNREIQVLKLSAQGAAVKQIAAQLGISVRTVEKHRSNIIQKTRTSNITEAVFYASNKQLLEAD